MAIVTYGKRIYDKCNYGKCNHYGKCNLWQLLLMASVTYINRIMASVIMAKVLRQMKLSSRRL